METYGVDIGKRGPNRLRFTVCFSSGWIVQKHGSGLSAQNLANGPESGLWMEYMWIQSTSYRRCVASLDVSYGRSIVCKVFQTWLNFGSC